MFAITSLWHSMKLAAVLPTKSKGVLSRQIYSWQFFSNIASTLLHFSHLAFNISLVLSSQTYIRKRVQSLWYPDFIHKFKGTSAAKQRKYWISDRIHMFSKNVRACGICVRVCVPQILCVCECVFVAPSSSLILSLSIYINHPLSLCLSVYLSLSLSAASTFRKRAQVGNWSNCECFSLSTKLQPTL
jgi:hypothetical protein